MNNDLAAAVAAQIAEQTEREATPHRYENVPVQDIAARVRDVQADIRSWRESQNEPVPAATLDEQFRALGERQAYGVRNEQAAQAYALACSLGKPIAPLSAAGEPLVAATRDLEVLIDWWRPGGPYAGNWPGIVCGPASGYFGLMVWGEGATWYRQLATVHRPSKLERIAAYLRPTDPVTEAGVPRPGGADPWDDDEDDTARKPDEIRPTMSAPLMLVEELPALQPLTTRTFRGPTMGRDARTALRATVPAAPGAMFGQIWSWPTGQTLPVGKQLRPGIRSLAAVPAFGSVLDFGARNRWKVRHFPSLLSPPPAWLVDALQRLGQ